MTDIQYLFFQDDGFIPNNPELPAAVYKKALEPGMIEDIFRRHQWSNSWTNGVLQEHHYHSNTHEVLGVAKGHARLMLGGAEGQMIDVECGDVLVLPAGTGHKCIEAHEGFTVIGAYPNGMDYNMKYGKPDERPAILEEIKQVPFPEADPVFGEDGPLLKKWMNTGFRI
ncbi:hypothetical protein AC622_03060 [Bacillus sp. FJAT-27916]|uniref:cupin domain-containing protein n=1 Tax=Bacillaceae TaxID=186817 RepID=UPI0006716B7D|nr:cupin domain-containing protein [Bacillus sp. FJAT-27916]KMY43359.1 hypothetical protein AC622_03060 [Bacillus sp. FJAT-27916]